jgi:branched-chain amino acid transport system ATP-binding protein
VVRDLSLHVARGEVVALLGANGAGKTTTLSALAGHLPAMHGRITLRGHDIGGTPAHRVARLGVSLVPEDRALFYGLTASENLRVATRGRRGPDSVLHFFPELESKMSLRAGLLSGGEQQMLAIGRAIATNPSVLLVDELSLGLAPVVVERLLPAMKAIAVERDVAVLVVEQHVPLVLGVADRVYVLRHGTCVFDAPASELARDPSVLAASYLGNVANPALSGTDS